MPRKILTEQEKERIYELCEIDGKSQKKVADFYGVSQSTISNIIKEQRYLRELDKCKQTIQKAVSYGVQRAIEDRENANSSRTSIECKIDDD